MKERHGDRCWTHVVMDNNADKKSETYSKSILFILFHFIYLFYFFYFCFLFLFIFILCRIS